MTSPLDRTRAPGTSSGLPAAQGRFPELESYVVTERLGSGATGEVFLAHHRELGSKYAIKVLAEAVDWEGEAAERFRREFQALGAIEHPGIVRVHFAGKTPTGRPYCVLDYVDGPTLAEAIATAGEEAVLDWIEQVADALGHAHEAGLVHRDVKPGNVLVERATQRPRLADFGLVKSMTPDAKSLTQSDAMLGTPRYMAPEQVRPGDPITPATDVFALGCILFEFLGKRSPYVGPNVLETFQNLASVTTPPALETGDSELDRRFGAFLARAIHPNPAMRQQDGHQFAEELRAARADTLGPSAPPAALFAFMLLLPFLIGGAIAAMSSEDELPPPPPGSVRTSPSPTPAASTPPTPAPSVAVQPAWTWAKGETRRYELQIKTELSVSAPGAARNFTGLRDYVLDLRCTEAGGDLLQLQAEIKEFRLTRELRVGQNEPVLIAYDSRRSQDPTYQTLLNQSFSFSLDPRSGRVESLSGAREIQDALDAATHGRHEADALCPRHTIPELADPPRLREVLELTFRRRKTSGASKKTWTTTRRLPWIPELLPRSPLSLDVEPHAEGTTWSARTNVDEALPGGRFAGKAEEEGRATFGEEGLDRAETKQTLRGAARDTAGSSAELQVRSETLLRRLQE